MSPDSCTWRLRSVNSLTCRSRAGRTGALPVGADVRVSTVAYSNVIADTAACTVAVRRRSSCTCTSAAAAVKSPGVVCDGFRVIFGFRR